MDDPNKLTNSLHFCQCGEFELLDSNGRCHVCRNIVLPTDVAALDTGIENKTFSSEAEMIEFIKATANAIKKNSG